MKKSIVPVLLASVMSLQAMAVTCPVSAYAMPDAVTAGQMDAAKEDEQAAPAEEEKTEEAVQPEAPAEAAEAEAPAETPAEEVQEVKEETPADQETPAQEPVQDVQQPDESVKETEAPAAPESEAVTEQKETEPAKQETTQKRSVKRMLNAAKPEQIKSERVLENGMYYFRSLSVPGVCLDVKGGKVTSGTTIQTYTLHGSNAQVFTVTYDEKLSLYRICNQRSGMPIAQQEGTDNVWMETAQDGKLSQYWAIIKNEDGSLTMQNAGSRKYLQVEGDIAKSRNIGVAENPADANKKFTADSKLFLTSANVTFKDQAYAAKALTPGTTVTLLGRTLEKNKDYKISYTNNVKPGTATVTLTGIGDYQGTLTKTFKITTPTQQIKNGYYRILNAGNNGFALDIHNGSTAAKANLQLYKRDGTLAQVFLVEWEGNGQYKISNVKSKMALDVAAGSLKDKANIQQYPSNDTQAQRWYILKNSDGSYTLINVKSDKALDINGGKLANEVNIHQYKPNGTNAQKFKFEYANDYAQQLPKPQPKLDQRLTGVVISWSKISGVSNYRVFRKTGSESWKILGTTSGTSFTDNTQKPNTTYYYTVRCLSADKTYYTSGFVSPGPKMTTPKVLAKNETELRDLVVQKAKSYIGVRGQSSTHMRIIDKFNELKPDGYPMYYTSPWCAAFVSSVTMDVYGNKTANKNFPLSYNCGTIIDRAEDMGIWVEKDSYVPKPGDWIIYDWDDDGYGENYYGADHVGMVTSVSGSTFVVTEGNYGNVCKTRNMKVNGRYIRGFVAPNYSAIRP